MNSTFFPRHLNRSTELKKKFCNGLNYIEKQKKRERKKDGTVFLVEGLRIIKNSQRSDN